MPQIFALEINLRAAELFRQSFRMKKRSRATGKILQKLQKFRLKIRIVAHGEISARQFFQSATSAFREQTARRIRPSNHVRRVENYYCFLQVERFSVHNQILIL